MMDWKLRSRVKVASEVTNNFRGIHSQMRSERRAITYFAVRYATLYLEMTSVFVLISTNGELVSKHKDQWVTIVKGTLQNNLVTSEEEGVRQRKYCRRLWVYFLGSRKSTRIAAHWHGNESGDCLLKTQHYANSIDIVYGVTRVQCWVKEKEEWKFWI